MEAGETLSGNRFVCNVFFEDGGEENRVWLVIFGGQDAGNSVAGDGNCWFAGAALLEELADLGGGQLAGGGKTYNDPDMTWQKWGWVSPKSAHGVLLEIASPYESHQDGKWHPASEAAAET